MDDRSDDEELVQLVELLRVSRLENAELKRNFEGLKGIHLQHVSSQQQLQSKYSALQEEKAGLERQHKAMNESWRSELQDLQRQLTDARRQIPKSQDIEVLRAKVLEEIEAPYNMKIDNLQREAEASQRLLLQLRREYEELLTAHKGLESRTTCEAELRTAEHLAVVTQLKDKVADLSKAPAKVSSLEAHVKSLQRDKDSLTFQLNKLQEELADVRRQKERARVDKESALLSVDKKIKDVQEEEVKLQGIVDSLTRKTRHLAKELSEAHRSNEEQYSQLVRAQADRAAMQEQLETFKKAAAIERQTLVQQYEDTIRKLEDKVDEYRREVHDRERQVAELHISHQEQISRLVEAHSIAVSDFESEAAQKAREWKEQRNELQAKIEALQDACNQYRQEMEISKRKEEGSSTAASKELDRLHASLLDMERTAASRATEIQALKQEVDKAHAQVSSLELSLAHMTRRKDELEAQIDMLHEEAKQAADKYHDLTKDLDDTRRALETNKLHAIDQLDAARQAAAAEKASLAKKYQAALHDLQRKHQDEMKRYKKKWRHSQLEVSQLTDEVTELKFRSHDLQNSLAAQGTSVMMPIMPRSLTASPRPMTAGTEMRSYLGQDLRSSVDAAIPSSMLSDLASLRQRQDQYLNAAQDTMGRLKC